MECIKCRKPLPEGAAFCPACGKKQAAERKHRKRANGTGTISKLSGNRAKPWQARRNNVSIGTFATRAEAQKALERLTDADVSERFNFTFQQVHDHWLPEHERTIGTHGISSYKSAMKNCQELHDRTFRSLRTSDFQAVIIRLEQEGKSKSTCEKVLQLFGQLSGWAIRESIQQVNYARFCTITAKQKTAGKVLPVEAIKRLQECNEEAAKVALVLLATGCRGNELFTVPLGNCCDRYFIGGSKTSAGRNRVVAVAPVGLEAYRQLLAKAKERGAALLIDGYDGNRIYANYAKRDFRELAESLGIEEFTPYDLRHTFATQAQRDGMDPQILRRQLGHADLKTTDKYYTHLEADDILQAVGALDVTCAVSYKLTTNKNEGKKSTTKSS